MQMMRIPAILVGFLSAAGAPAANAQLASASPRPVWQGDLFVKVVSTACTTQKITQPGAFYRTVYRPNLAKPPHGQAAEALSVNAQRSGFIIEATGTTLRGKGAKANSLEIGSRAEVTTLATTVDLTITPGIKATTAVVQISGTINNFFNVAGCNASVVGALGLRVD
jgi:hypothetical protein